MSTTYTIIQFNPYVAAQKVQDTYFEGRTPISGLSLCIPRSTLPNRFDRRTHAAATHTGCKFELHTLHSPHAVAIMATCCYSVRRISNVWKNSSWVCSLQCMLVLCVQNTQNLNISIEYNTSSYSRLIKALWCTKRLLHMGGPTSALSACPLHCSITSEVNAGRKTGRLGSWKLFLPQQEKIQVQHFRCAISQT